MTIGELPNEMNPKFREGFEAGFKSAEVYFKAELKQFYKAMKKDFLSKVATTTWVSPEWKKEILEKKKKDIESKLEEIKQGK